MNSIARKVLFVGVALLVIAIALFLLVWHFDGFHAAWQLFFKSGAILSFLELVDLRSWFISMVISLVVVFVLEACVCHKLKGKAIRLTIDIVAFIVSIIGTLQIMMA